MFSLNTKKYIKHELSLQLIDGLWFWRVKLQIISMPLMCM